MTLFISLFLFLVLQRLVELFIAKRNEKWMIAQGAIEFGQSHYRLMVLMHTLFFISFLFEVVFFQKNLSLVWPVLLPAFLLAQIGRMWVLTSLGRFWNTKIIVLPQAELVRKGPYRYIKHPNYAIVIIEFLVIPMLYNAYITAAVFTILNLAMLAIRIPQEEQALEQYTKYQFAFTQTHRFLPRNIK